MLFTILETLATSHPDFNQSLKFKNVYFKALKLIKERENHEFLLGTIHQLKQSKITEFNPLITTLKNWSEEIIQSFIEVHKWTREVIRHFIGAVIEGINNKI